MGRPLRVEVDGRTIRVGSRRRRLLLATLLAQCGVPVTPDLLIEVMWEGAPSSGAADTLRWNVHQLRADIGRHRLVKHTDGYALHLEAGVLDAQRFTALLDRAGTHRHEQRTTAARDTLRTALSMWHGDAYTGLDDADPVRTEAVRLNELRAVATELLIDTELELGRHSEITPELAALVGAHPLRERLRAQLMLALYRGGRRAEALATYAEGRELLAIELGIDPGTELQRRHTAILRDDPNLGHDAPASRIPQQLPPDVADFVGRDDLLTRLDALPGSGVAVISALSGAGGIGKTALAVHWAHRSAARFGGGRLFADLAGFGPGRPRDPAEVLAQFLRSLGMPPHQVPTALADRVAEYRSLTAARPVLVILDNAVDAQQVRPLLPSVPRRSP